MDNGKNLIKYKIIKAINPSWESCDFDILLENESKNKDGNESENEMFS